MKKLEIFDFYNEKSSPPPQISHENFLIHAALCWTSAGEHLYNALIGAKLKPDIMGIPRRAAKARYFINKDMDILRNLQGFLCPNPSLFAKLSIFKHKFGDIYLLSAENCEVI